MGLVFNTCAGLAASAISRSRRRKELKRIEQQNAAARNLTLLGAKTAAEILPENDRPAQICIAGGTEDVRRELLVQNCRQAAAAGMAVILIHEGDRLLEQALQQTFQYTVPLRIINDNTCYYDPIFRLAPDAAARLLEAASRGDQPIGAEGEIYLKALTKLLQKKGITPYIRMLADCPHAQIQTVILQMEEAGQITAAEADDIRMEIAAGEAGRSEAAAFLSHLTAETHILPWKKDLFHCTSMAECITQGGILSIDVQSAAKREQMSLLAAEVKACIGMNRPFRVILSAAAAHPLWTELLKKRDPVMKWTLSVPDLTGIGDAAEWLALSHQAVLFAHGIPAAEQLSALLGEYEHAEVTVSHTGSNNMGGFGYHFGANQTMNVSRKKERVIETKEITSMAEGEFLLLDNHTAFLARGVLI